MWRRTSITNSNLCEILTVAKIQFVYTKKWAYFIRGVWIGGPKELHRRRQSNLCELMFLRNNVIKCRKYCMEQMTSLGIVRDVMVSDENKHMRENHTMVIACIFYGAAIFNCPI